MKPKIYVAIQYAPRSRGVRLALAYCRIRRGSEPFFDLYGFCIGYSGGGAYEDYFFHVGEQGGAGFISYTPADAGSNWADDRIGVSGLAEQDFADGVEDLLESVRDRLMTRWCCWTDDGLPDLRSAAKRRLDCVRREVFYTSRGFDANLLGFLSSAWPISITFGDEAEEFDRRHQAFLKRQRARRRGFVAALVRYPQLIENGLQLLAHEAFGRCERAKLLFADKLGHKLVVAAQWDALTERDLERITTLKRDVNASERRKTRLMVVTTNIEPAVRSVLGREGISCREIRLKEVCRFLTEERDRNLAALFERNSF